MMKIGYVNVFVSDFSRAVDFYQNVLGLKLGMQEDQFGYASFDGGTSVLQSPKQTTAPWWASILASVLSSRTKHF